MATQFGGLWPAMLTPLKPDGAPNLPAIEKLVEKFVEDGLDGLYIIGSTGQWPMLSLDQRCSVAERVVAAAAGRIRVMVHVGAVATSDAIVLAQHAARVGADAISCVSPIYYPASADAVFEHYRAIGQAGDLPLFVYHLSGVNQLAIDPREYVDRLLALPNIAGMKFTDRDLYQFGLIQAYAAGRLQMFSGADELLCHAVLCGAVGAIGTFYNVWGRSCRKARLATAAGSIEVGRRFMLAFQQVIHKVLTSNGLWSFLRTAVLIKTGVDVGAPRPPLGTKEKPWAEVDVRRMLDEIDGCMDAIRPGE